MEISTGDNSKMELLMDLVNILGKMENITKDFLRQTSKME
jgi:hypothetical protein